MTKKSKYRFIKDGWGNRVNFQASFGLNMTPDDLEEGNLILEALMNDSDLEEEAEPAAPPATSSDNKKK